MPRPTRRSAPTSRNCSTAASRTAATRWRREGRIAGCPNAGWRISNSHWRHPRRLRPPPPPHRLSPRHRRPRSASEIYPRNTIEVDEAVNLLKLQKLPVRAIIMSASYRAAAKFIEKTRNLYPEMIFTSISGVGGTSLADELKLLGPRYTTGVLVTQVVPAVSGHSSAVIEYKNALAKYFPGEAPDYASLEGFVAANILIDALKRTGAQLDTEKLVDALESTRNLDLGLGVQLNFARSDHQASHKIWGTALDETGRFQPVDLE
jgi:branched-chain amino acid transport system substrate-binding protein